MTAIKDTKNTYEHPGIKEVYDILYCGGELSDDRVKAIVQNYNNADYPEDYPTEIKTILYDGNQFGAWVYCDPGTGEFDWLYIAAGDEVNRQMIVLAASSEVKK